MRVLVVNAGSSTLKLRLLGAEDELVALRDMEWRNQDPDLEPLRAFLADAGEFDAVGHRVVHGGGEFRGPVVVDGGVVSRLTQLSDLAPLHNPPALAALQAVLQLVPDVPSVVCFDTAFHADLYEEAAVYAVPWEWTERWGIRRYGFHGLSHAYAARRTAELMGRPLLELRVVTCHLGAGASLAAVHGGRSVDTTMGFTPLEGLVMATRSGSVDPGALLWLQERAGLSIDEMQDALEHRSGLLGLAGSADMREVLAAEVRGEQRGRLAVAVYVHRLRALIAAMASSMGGLEALVFTGGVGENSAWIRADACAALGFIGVAVDPARNAVPGHGDVDLTAEGSHVRVLRILAREDLQIASEVRRTLGATSR